MAQDKKGKNEISSVKKEILWAGEQALIADTLLANSSELLKLVIQLAFAVDFSVNSLKAVMFTAQQFANDKVLNPSQKAGKINNTTVDIAKSVTQIAAYAAISIRRIIGWDDHHYLAARRNGPDTLIGIKRTLIELSEQFKLAAGSGGPQREIFSNIFKRIIVMVAAADANIVIARRNAIAVESLEVMIIQFARAIPDFDRN